jgi:hypothetical protein
MMPRHKNGTLFSAFSAVLATVLSILLIAGGSAAAAVQICGTAIDRVQATSTAANSGACCPCCATGKGGECSTGFKETCGQDRKILESPSLPKIESQSIGLSPSPAQVPLASFAETVGPRPVPVGKTVYLINGKLIC